MPTTTAQSQRVNPRPAQAVAPYPISLTYQNKQLALYARLKSRLNALKYHYDRLQLASDLDNIYFDHVQKLAHSIYLLDNTNFICNDTYNDARRVFKVFPKSNDEHVIYFFGKVLPRVSRIEHKLEYAKREYKYALKFNKNVQKYKDKLEMAESSYKLYEKFKTKVRLENLAQRRSILKKRLRYAIAESAHSGWFLVFASLTADDHNIGKVFSLDSKVWTDYIRSVDRAVGIRCYGSWHNAINARNRGEDFHKYFAVVELGSKRGRPHIHVIHMMKQLPEGTKDPNFGLVIPYRLNMEIVHKFWTHGICSTWFAMRYSNNDAFGKINWRMPSPKNEKTGKYVSIPVGSPMRIANYVCKYINKSYGEDNERKNVIWRTKMSRNLGLTPLIQLTDKIQIHNLLPIVVNPPTLTLLNQRIPTFLLRKLAYKRWLTLKSKTMKNILSAISRLERRASILKSFKDSIEMTEGFNSVKCGDIKIADMKGMDIFNTWLQIELDKISYDLFGDNKTINITNQNLGGYIGERFYG